MSDMEKKSAMKRKWLLFLAGLLVVGELATFLVAWNGSGDKRWIQVKSEAGTTLYEAPGETLTRFDRYYFEQNFGPLSAYKTELVTRKEPFPLTGWLFAAIGVPVGLVLFAAFSIKVWRSLFPSGERKKEPNADSLHGFADRLSRGNVFAIGGLVFVAALSLWVVPTLIARTAEEGLSLVMEYKWVFAVLFAGLGGLACWFLYLRYLLAKKAIETRAELDRFRISMEIERKMALPDADRPALSHAPEDQVPEAEMLENDPVKR